ncbi:glycosyltransferase family 4 protein [Synechocystis sp. PCC 7338]|uniref:glycosyltransferase family 4 protein n=1 Tax=Synechocystis sp. PCC 7338 TaxID=2732530 RepID=UPI001BB00020|nr:glycosyltransferase family 4 protein [Synechocystis sp. PCC 7338]QUS61525.1 glycosyltransferase family 4 protein [Synechocystis sp. PCC 7338]
MPTSNTALSPAIFYESEGYRTSGSRLMGRHSAGEAFLRAVIQGTPPSNPIFGYCRDAESFGAFKADVLRHDPTSGDRLVQWLPRHQPEKLGNASILYLPGPGLLNEAQRRLGSGQEQSYSLCGITHTISSAGAMQSIRDLLIAPVHGWDAIICTSKAVKASLETIIAEQAEYLRVRLGARFCEMPQFPVIPLGVHCQDFQFTTAEKQTARARLGIAPEDVVVLFVGRLVFHAKAHPLPLYLALERAAAEKSVTLIECGWFPNEPVARSYDQARQLGAPNIGSIVLDGRQPSQRRDAWAAADIFTSLSDNIQESFGLTPIEAMAAGLPSVVSDWDGYKDTIRDGIDGFRIPTTMPSDGGDDFALRHLLDIDSYDFYIGHVSQTVAVDIEAAALAFHQLLRQPELRQRMGTAAKKQAQTVFDWSCIYGRYQELWHHLTEKRRQVSGDRQLPRGGAMIDPYKLFTNYPTNTMGNLQFALRENVTLAEIETIGQLESVKFASYVLPPMALVDQIVQNLNKSQPLSLEELQSFVSVPMATLEKAISWLLKYGLIKSELILRD